MRDSQNHPVHSRARAVVTCALAALLLPAAAVPAAGAQTEPVTTVRIERERPASEKLPTLRFLQANRDFIRTRFDHLRQESRNAAAPAADLDPRFLRYRQMLAEVAANKDSVTLAADARERAGLFTSVHDLGELERELDQMESLLDAQRARLAVLQGDFAGHQRTELDVLIAGSVKTGEVDSVVVTLDDGRRMASGLTETQRNSLKHGGTLEVFRGLVEPREQSIDVVFLGEGWSAAGHGIITLEPARDRLTFLKLDLTEAQPARGITSVMAGTWLLDPELPTADATRDHP
ncbi:MAG TPA: hypothetical protein VI504_14180 [Candidatus Eisenbacteria bacterium]|jgi:hypothetical protein